MPSTLSPTIEIKPACALADEPVQIQLSAFPSNCDVTIRVETHDDEGTRWQSHAIFHTDDAGFVDLAVQSPRAGTYHRADVMGLFWSLTLDDGEAKGFSKGNLANTQITFTAFVDDKPLTTTTCERLFLAPGATRAVVRENGLAGTFFCPPGIDPLPAVIVLGGSSGGLEEATASLLASHSYATLALAYFAYDHLPSDLQNIPLEYFETAIQWLQAQPRVRGDTIGVMGRSRGGELALLLGATFPILKAVVAHVPSGFIWGESPWTFRGEPLPHVPSLPSDDFERQVYSKSPIALTPLFLRDLDDLDAIQNAAIPVEKINAPVLLISAQDDQMWPSAYMSELVMARLQKHQHPFPDEHISYPGAGHFINVPYLPATVTHRRHRVHGHDFAFGGNPPDIAVAQVDAWRRILGFLETQLAPHESSRGNV